MLLKPGKRGFWEIFKRRGHWAHMARGCSVHGVSGFDSREVTGDVDQSREDGRVHPSLPATIVHFHVLAKTLRSKSCSS